MAEKLIIDADPGIGDALAIALALRDPHIEVVGLTATGGRTSGEHATHNLLSIVSLLDPDRWPRIGTSELAAFPVARDHCMPHPTQLNGAAGLGDLVFPAVALHQRHESAKLLADLVKAEPHQLTLLTLGPLTNVELACDLYPEFLTDLKSLVCLGGAVAMGGDVTAAAEFNVFANPEAARKILTYPATKTLLPLDTSHRVALSFEQFDRLEIDSYSRFGRLLQQTLPFALRAYRQHMGMEGMPLHEVVALASIARPRLFEREAMRIDVELTGELTRGATVFDRRRTQHWQTNIDVLTGIDIQGVVDYLTQLVRG